MKITILILLIISAISTYILTLFVRKYAIKKAIIDTPNERSSHTVPTPRGGGIAIGIIWYLALTVLKILNEIDTQLFFALLSGFVLFVVGFIDDRIDLNPKIRIIVQLLTSGLALWFLGGVSNVNFGFIEINSSLIFTPIALIGIVWFINLFNFVDGIDGYASMETIFISLCYFFLLNDNVLLLLAVATFGFILWNWQPAKIFLGDSGSTMLGFNLIIFAIYYQNTTDVSIFTLLIPSVIFWFDATWTLFRRFRNKEKLTQAHKKHAYQRIVQSGFSHQKTVIAALMINLILASLFISSVLLESWLIIFFVLSIIISYISMKLIDRKKPF